MIEPNNGAASHGITHPKRRTMLAALARTGNVSAAARAADIWTVFFLCLFVRYFAAV